MENFEKLNERTIKIIIPREPQELTFTKDDLVRQIADIDNKVVELQNKKSELEKYLAEGKKLGIKLASEMVVEEPISKPIIEE